MIISDNFTYHLEVFLETHHVIIDENAVMFCASLLLLWLYIISVSTIQAYKYDYCTIEFYGYYDYLKFGAWKGHMYLWFVGSVEVNHEIVALGWQKCLWV